MTYQCRRLDGKVAIVAGASSGIGRITALRLASEGAAVVIAAPARERARLEAVAMQIREAGGVSLAQNFEATEDASAAALVQRAMDEFGWLNVINANFADLGTIHDDSDAVQVTDEVFDRTIDVNLKGMLRLTRHAIPKLLRSGGGAIIYTSSTAAIAGEPERPCYAMSKAGINALVRHVASRWGVSNIRANAIMPGFIVTDENRGKIPSDWLESVLLQSRANRHGKPEDIAAMVALLASADGEWINGQTIAVDGGSVLH